MNKNGFPLERRSLPTSAELASRGDGVCLCVCSRGVCVWVWVCLCVCICLCCVCVCVCVSGVCVCVCVCVTRDHLLALLAESGPAEHVLLEAVGLLRSLGAEREGGA